MNEQINRNHARCVLRTALQKWRSLRADNVTVATVIFDIEQYAYQDNEILIKLGRYVNASQALSDRQDAMLAVSRKENVLLTTQRTPVIYNGSKDQNFCRVLYRGPGFRTHEEEIVEERRNLALKCSDSNNSFGNSSFGVRKGDEENVEYDDEDDEDVRDEPSEEVELSVRFNDDSKTVTLIPSPPRPPRPHAPMPVFVNEEEEEGDSEPASTSSGPDSESTKHFKGTPSKTPPAPTVRRVKAEAVRRLRTPKISASTSSPERRVTRSASRNACKPEEMVVLKTPSPQKRSKDLLTTPEVTVTPRRSTRLNGAMCTPVATADLSLIGVNGSAARLTMSRKRVHSNSSTTYSHSRITMVSSTTGITPVVSTLSLINSKITTTTTTDAAPSRSAPTTPKKSTKSVSKWSLSKLDLARKEHGIVRVEEIADEEEGGADAEDVMREPPSKIRRFYGYMRNYAKMPKKFRNVPEPFQGVSVSKRPSFETSQRQK
uniref:Uncharacterized protein n=1 Tax=Caenorhabditis japonica TaxID=281687 RepID=A0A8R1HLG9_CAEJA